MCLLFALGIGYRVIIYFDIIIKGSFRGVTVRHAEGFEGFIVFSASSLSVLDRSVLLIAIFHVVDARFLLQYISGYGTGFILLLIHVSISTSNAKKAISMVQLAQLAVLLIIGLWIQIHPSLNNSTNCAAWVSSKEILRENTPLHNGNSAITRQKLVVSISVNS